MSTFTITETIEGLTCANCHVLYGLQSDYRAAKRRDHGTFYCPNGHAQHYPGKSDLEQVTAERDAARELATRERQRRENALKEVEHQRRRVAAAKGRITRIKNRIANGVCPCCSRHFENVQRHMTSQHPTYTLPTLDLDDGPA